VVFFFSSRRRHTRFSRDWSSDVCSSDLDRLNFKGHKVSIIDYKTGKLMPGHRDQMEGYAAILNEMGFEVEKKILIYINNDVKIRSEERRVGKECRSRCGADH